MARYTGARVRVCRALDCNLPGLTRKTRDKRPTRPGQHGVSRRRGQPSDYKIRLQEKQKLRYNYGLSEKSLRRYMAMAIRSKESTAVELCRLVERRLDSVVFRLGIAPTIPAARQLIGHGHVRVGGRKVDIASYLLKPGQIVSLREKSKTLAIVEESLAAPSLTVPDFLEWDGANKEGKFIDMPGPEHIPFEFGPNLVIEYYSQRM